MVRAIGFILLMLCPSFLHAQNVHVSQFWASDHTLNPAQVGQYDGDIRAMALYRNQWRQIGNAPLTTSILGYDQEIKYYNQDIHAGLAFVRDQFSGFQTITNKVILTGSYGMEWFNTSFRGGIQLGLVTNSTDLSVQTFPNQWDYQNGVFNPNIPNGEVNIRPSQMYGDVNIGFNCSKKFNQFSLSSGIAFNHINRPKDTYFEQVFQRRKVRGVYNLSAAVPITNIWEIQPKLFWMWTAKANDFLFGSRIKYSTKMDDLPHLYGGLFYRHGIKRTFDAVYPTFGLTYLNFDFGVSLDLNVSDLNEGIKRPKTVEFSLIYTIPDDKVRFIVPACDRY